MNVCTNALAFILLPPSGGLYSLQHNDIISMPLTILVVVVATPADIRSALGFSHQGADQKPDSGLKLHVGMRLSQ